ncbi:MAG TPA: hypothetical protein VGC66_19025 [Pyrinomonadaceae bacterium]
MFRRLARCLQALARVSGGLRWCYRQLRGVDGDLRSVYRELRGVYKRLRAFPGSCARFPRGCAGFQKVARVFRSLRWCSGGCAGFQAVALEFWCSVSGYEEMIFAFRKWREFDIRRIIGSVGARMFIASLCSNVTSSVRSDMFYG